MSACVTILGELVFFCQLKSLYSLCQCILQSIEINVIVKLFQAITATSEVGGSIPVTALSGKAGSCLPLVGSLQYTTLANSMYWFPLPFQLPVVI